MVKILMLHLDALGALPLALEIKPVCSAASVAADAAFADLAGNVSPALASRDARGASIAIVLLLK